MTRSTLVLSSVLWLAGQPFVVAGDPAPFGRIEFTREPARGFCPPLDAVFRAVIEAREVAPGDVRYGLEMTFLEEGTSGEDVCLEVIAAGVDCVKETTLPPRDLDPGEVEALVPLVLRTLFDPEEEAHPQCGLVDLCLVNSFDVDGRVLTDEVCAAPRLSFEQSAELIRFLEGLRRENVIIENGDTNGDGVRDLTDAIYLLRSLFAGGPPPVSIDCSVVFPCPASPLIFENGDTNGDEEINLTDAVYLLRWLFAGGPRIVPACDCVRDPGCEDCPAPARCVAVSPDARVCTATIVSCDELHEVYNYLTSDFGRSCDPDSGCHLLWGHCGIGIGGCYHAVSSALEQADLDALAARYQELNCFGPVCDCAPPPAGAACLEGHCEFFED